MSKPNGLLLTVFAGLMLFIAWSATEPNQYLVGPDAEAAPQTYPWNYPAWLAAFAVAVIGSTSFSKPLTRFIGALFSFVFGACLVVLLAITVMHSPPVHVNLLYVMFFSSLGLLFYLGYTFAILRRQANGGRDVS